MSQGVGSAKQILGSADTFGGHLYGIADYSGPAAYVQGGDTIDPRIFGMPNRVFTLIGSIDQSGAYQAVGRPLNNGYTQWQLVWISLATGEEVGAGTNLSAITVRLSALGY